MADEVPVIDNLPVVNPEIEAEARRGGWASKDRWRGDPKDWVDAETFVRRGREIAPHVKKENLRLEQENAALKATQANQAREIEEMRNQVAGLTTFRDDMGKREYNRIRAEILNEIQVAREKGDFGAEARALDKLTKQQPAAPAAAPARVEPPAAPVKPQVPQAMTDWVSANDWYSKDPVLQQAMNIVGAELRTTGQLVGMDLAQQLDATAKIVLQRYTALPSNNGGGRVEGNSRPPDGGPSNPAPSTGTWESLPANLKAECDAQGERLGLIGDKKAFKTKEAWRQHYVREYNRYTPGTGYDYRPPGN